MGQRYGPLVVLANVEGSGEAAAALVEGAVRQGGGEEARGRRRGEGVEAGEGVDELGGPVEEVGEDAGLGWAR